MVSTGVVDAPETIDWAVVWKPPPGTLGRLTNLRCVFSLGAGVDNVLADGSFPTGVPLSRVVDPYLTAGMSEYVVLHVLAAHRDLPRSDAAQREGRWDHFFVARANETRVGILGLGELGLDAARKLMPFGYRIASWTLTRKSEPGVESFAGLDELPAFLARTQILVCLLPLTPETRGILNATTLAQLPRGVRLINAARGAHVVDAELIAALDRGHIDFATLDVFDPEPLPESSPLWRHPRVRITPHTASLTDARSVALAMVESMARIRRGAPPLNLVDISRGY